VSPWAYLEGGAGAAPNQNFLALFKYSLSSFLPNHMYSSCRISW